MEKIPFELDALDLLDHLGVLNVICSSVDSIGTGCMLLPRPDDNEIGGS